MIAFAVYFIIFVVVVVIVVLIAQWGMAKIGWTIDPTLKVIVGLVVFLVCLLFFLNFMGMFGSSGFSFPHR